MRSSEIFSKEEQGCVCMESRGYAENITKSHMHSLNVDSEYPLVKQKNKTKNFQVRAQRSNSSSIEEAVKGKVYQESALPRLNF